MNAKCQQRLSDFCVACGRNLEVALYKTCNVRVYVLEPLLKNSADVRKKSLAIIPFKPEFIIVIFIHYKPRIAVQFSTCSG